MTPETYVQERPKMIRYAYRILHNLSAAEDAADMAIGRAIVRFEQDKPENVPGWLAAIVRNVCFHLLRDNKRHGEILHENVVQLSTKPTVNKELVEKVDAALLHLTPRQRLALELFHFQELDHQEVAEIMEIAPGAVRALVHRAKRRLSRILSDWSEAS